VANSLGWSIEEATGALSVLYNAGFDGSMAGTSLRQSLVALMNPSSSAKKIFEQLGIELSKLDPTTNRFSDIVDTLAQSGITTAQAMEVFGARAGPGMMALLAQGGDAIASMTDRITGTNAATEMAEKQINTMQGSAKLMKSMMEETAISIGDVLIPILRKLMENYLMPLTASFQGLSSASKETVVKIAMIAAAIGPLCF
jgi:TP901 family phage tail tape measure protein